jgi:hypothetical protein
MTRPYPWPAGYGGLTHIEKVSLEGEHPRPTPDFARTLAIASALNDHHWVEPYVSEEWRAEAKRELDDMVEQEGAVDGDADDGSSSVYTNEEEEDGEVSGRETAADEKDGDSSSPSSDERPVWPKGVVGLI